ncbi:MAG: response regulator transcription factor [Candidatus Eremiobacterota bacterium]
MSEPYRIVIADDHPLVRSGIRATLAEESDLELVGEACDGDEALRLVVSQRPDLLVVDLSMPGLAADELIGQAREHLPELKALVLSAYDDDVFVRRLMQARISGYLLKDEAADNLVEAIRAIRRGAVWFSQGVALKMMGVNGDPLGDLTPRERQVLERIARGMDNQAIAEDLHLAEQTVRNYASTIYEKIGVGSRVEAVVWARERGVLREGTPEVGRSPL